MSKHKDESTVPDNRERERIDPALTALRQWEVDTEKPASASEGNAFMDGFAAGQAALAPAESREPSQFSDEYDQKAVDVIKNLVMLVRRLCYRLNKHEPDSKMIDQALGYLRGEGLQGSVLRDSEKGEATPAPKCKYGDPACPCQDGDMCHYEGPNPMKPPSLVASDPVEEVAREIADEELISILNEEMANAGIRMHYRFTRAPILAAMRRAALLRTHWGEHQPKSQRGWMGNRGQFDPGD